MKLKPFMFIASGFLFLCLGPVVAAEEAHDDHEGHHREEETGRDEHGEHHDDAGVHLGSRSQEIVGLKVIKTKKMPLFSGIEVVGDIAQDTENVKHITAPAAGTLQSTKVGVGDVVENGTLLAEMVASDGQSLAITSPLHGIVMAKYARDGEPLNVISSILTIADPDLLRASFNVYEKDLAGLKPGLKVIVKSMAYPDEEFEGKIVFVSPQVDVKTRAIRVRANIKNEKHLLKFGMYVSGKILVPVSDETVVLPEEAVQEIKGQTVVFTPNSAKKDAFELREIKIGKKAPGFVEVLAGLEEGEDVVGQGSFYLKSELLKGELGHGHAH